MMPASARTPRLVVMITNGQNPAYSGARIGADRVVARFGCALTQAVPATPDDVDEQRAPPRTVHAERRDAVLAVLIAPVHAIRLNGTLRAMRRTAPRSVICEPSRSVGAHVLCGFGRPGHAAAHRLFDRLEGEGASLPSKAIPTPSRRRRRATGFRAAAAERPDVAS